MNEQLSVEWKIPKCEGWHFNWFTTFDIAYLWTEVIRKNLPEGCAKLLASQSNERYNNVIHDQFRFFYQYKLDWILIQLSVFCQKVLVICLATNYDITSILVCVSWNVQPTGLHFKRFFCLKNTSWFIVLSQHQFLLVWPESHFRCYWGVPVCERNRVGCVFACYSTSKKTVKRWCLSFYFTFNEC